MILSSIKTISSIACMLVFSASTLASDQLLSLKNLERERAAYLNAALTQTDNTDANHKASLNKLRQLSDMERMVIRDDRLAENNSTLVANAFNNFELTFLVHASAEKDTTVLSHWLEEVGFSSKAVLSTRPGYRK